MRWYTYLIGAVLLIILYGSCSDAVEKLHGYGGRTLSEVVDEFGTPDVEIKIWVNDESPLYDYQYGLYDYAPADSAMHVMEVSWQTMWQTKVMWFKQQGDTWIGMEGLRWGPGVRFQVPGLDPA